MVHWDSNPMSYQYKGMLGHNKLGLKPNSYHYGASGLDLDVYSSINGIIG